MPSIIARHSQLVALALIVLLGGCASDAVCTITGCDMNQQLAEVVQQRLNGNLDLKTQNLRVEVIGSEAYIYGTVDTTRDFFNAQDIAKKTPGITKVVNGLAIGNTL